MGPSSNCRYQDRVGAEGLENRLAEKHLGELRHNGMNTVTNTPWQQRGNSILGCTRQSIASRLREVILSLCSALVRHTWRAVSNSRLPSTRQTWTCWQESSTVPWRSVRGWNISHMGEMGKMEPDSSQQYPVKGQAHKLKYRMIKHKKKIFWFCPQIVRLTEDMEEAAQAESPPLKISEIRLDTSLSNLP